MGILNIKALSAIFTAQAAWYKDTRVSADTSSKDIITEGIQLAGKWISSLTDPVLGDIGRKFMAQTVASGCKQVIDTTLEGCMATYCSFSYNPRGFLNNITYGARAEENLPLLFSAKVHEETHAQQKMLSTALHASPFNPDTKIIICPRDWVMLEELCERDAYTKQAYFNTLLAQYLPEVRETSKFDPVSVEEFEAIKASTSDIHEALIEAARRTLDKSWASFNPEYKFRNLIQDVALRNYENGMTQREKCRETGLIFVRLEEEDVAAIGASCGPNVFGKNGVLPEFLEKPVLRKVVRSETVTSDPQKKLDALNARCGITDSDKLPTLSEALKMLGMTREQFIAHTDKNTTPPSSILPAASSPCQP